MSDPRASVNQISEYVGANSTRRKKIVEDAKNPSSFIVARYTEARKAISNYIAEGDLSCLDECADFLKNKVATSDFQKNDKKKSLEALLAIRNIDLSFLSGFEMDVYSGSNPKLQISGLDISVNPDIIIRGEHRGKKIIGAVKLHISSSAPLTEEMGKSVAMIIHEFIKSHVQSADETAHLKFCISLDIFNGRLTEAPTSVKKRLSKIGASCEEFVLRWDSI
ncbi:MAG: hypothetical protein ACJAWV_003288 [Flammeovirgaceae bacterium]|jgi:hypothetical protein